jgi:lysophospholipase L1-like esterase
MKTHLRPLSAMLTLLSTALLLILVSFILPENIIRQSGLKPLKLAGNLTLPRPVKKYHYQAFADTIEKLDDSLTVADTSQSSKIDILSLGSEYYGLQSFFQKLSELGAQKKKIRIAYFGDSMIEGDLITQQLRNLLQKKFGGKGVGFVPAISNIASFRQSIRQTFSEDWEQHTLLEKPPADKPLGLSGYYHAKKANNTEAWISLKPSNQLVYSVFPFVKFYYGKTSDTRLNIECKGEKQIVNLEGNETLNELVLPFQDISESIKITIQSETSVPVYGFSIEGEEGIYVDNYAFRGNSGMANTRIVLSMLNAFQKKLEYDLVILHYGVNAVSETVKDYSWYRKGIHQSIQHFKQGFENASFLFITCGDKGYVNDEGEIITNPAVPLVINAQTEAAANTGIASLNFYELMGGENSMKKWVDANPPFANKDYTHLNFRGAQRTAELIYHQLDSAYSAFIHQKKLTRT